MRRLIVLMCFVSLLSYADLELVKDARKSNPTLKIKSWDGDREALNKLAHVLTYADWFTLTNENTADYYLEGVAKDTPKGLKMTLKLVTGDGTSTSFSVMDKPDWPTFYKLVDSIILKVFKNPGFCQTKIAFVKRVGASNEIYISRFDGSQAKKFTTSQRSIMPRWAQKDRYLIYTRYSKIKQYVVVHDFQRNAWKSVAAFNGLNSGGHIANTSLKTTLLLSKEGQVDLYVHDISAAKPVYTRLTNDKLVESSPCWSPDDKFICYVSNQTRRPSLYMIPATGGKPKRLIEDTSSEAVSPDWSKVSNKICFAYRVGGRYAIAVLDMAKGGHPSIIIPDKHGGNWGSPSWCADGRHIVCSRDTGGTTTLYLVDSWYGTVRPLHAGNGSSLPDSSD